MKAFCVESDFNYTPDQSTSAYIVYSVSPFENMICFSLVNDDDGIYDAPTSIILHFTCTISVALSLQGMFNAEDFR